jgi:hypothetical protein
VVQQVLRDVRENHLTGRAKPVQRAECDQPVAGADVEQRVGGAQLSLVKYMIPDRVQELGQQLFARSDVAAVAHVGKPPVPAVRAILHIRSSSPTAGARGNGAGERVEAGSRIRSRSTSPTARRAAAAQAASTPRPPRG